MKKTRQRMERSMKKTRRGSFVRAAAEPGFKVMIFDDQGPVGLDVEGDGMVYPTEEKATAAAWELWDDIDKDPEYEVQVWAVDAEGVEDQKSGPVAIVGMSTSEPTIGSGETVTREQALEMLKTDSIPEGKHLMILNWAPDQHPNEWIGVTDSDLEQVEEYTTDEDHFELW